LEPLGQAEFEERREFGVHRWRVAAFRALFNWRPAELAARLPFGGKSASDVRVKRFERTETPTTHADRLAPRAERRRQSPQEWTAPGQQCLEAVADNPWPPVRSPRIEAIVGGRGTRDDLSQGTQLRMNGRSRTSRADINGVRSCPKWKNRGQRAHEIVANGEGVSAPREKSLHG
jgi:hypothetical protein